MTIPGTKVGEAPPSEQHSDSCSIADEPTPESHSRSQADDSPFTQLRLCWCDPNATAELNATYRSRQYRTVLDQFPVTIGYSILINPLLCALFHHQVNPAVLLLWTAAMSVLAVTNIALWLANRSASWSDPVGSRAVWLLTVDVAVTAVLFAAISPYLFAHTDTNGKLAITALSTGYIAVGSWLYSALPRAGVAWAGLLGSVLATGLALQTTASPLLIFMLCFYAAACVTGVLLSSKAFVRGLIINTEADRQRQLVGLLLNDFEEGASDWLWETDLQGRLRNVSIGVAEAFGQSTDQLDGQDLARLIASCSTCEDGLDLERVQPLAKALGAGVAFADLEVSVNRNGKQVWWSLTAKPLMSAHGQIEGWRGVGSDITEPVEREQEMTRLANTDSLTGLANRHHFNHRLRRHFKSISDHRTEAVLLLLDLDGFKAINDTFGHAVGDELLTEVATRLRSSIRADQLAARLGGDEFAVFVPEGIPEDQLERFAYRILDALAAPWSINGHEIVIEASLGVAYAPRDGDNGDRLLKSCDLALYNSKANGPRSVCFYHSGMGAEASHKQTLLADMGSGIEDNEFFVQYQPQVMIGSGRIVGYEALVRWQHPTQGLIAPDDFVPLAEESGIIVPLGSWVLNQACLAATRLPTDVSIAVNVSGRQFSDSGLLDVVHRALEVSGLASHRLVLELTESSLMQNTESAQSILNELRSRGVRIALDDFGTGYSSLSYLRSFPIDKLKIDRSFVKSLGPGSSSGREAIATAIVQLARALRLETIAEGIESEAQAQFLGDIGCTRGQGFLYAKPLDLDDALRLTTDRLSPLT